jgi:hypothetical protein
MHDRDRLTDTGLVLIWLVAGILRAMCHSGWMTAKPSPTLFLASRVSLVVPTWGRVRIDDNPTGATRCSSKYNACCSRCIRVRLLNRRKPLIGDAMKFIQAFLMLCASLSLTAFGQSELSLQSTAPKPPFKLEITANLDNEHSYVWDFANNAQTVVKAGSMIVVAVRKTNISDHEIAKGSCVGDDASGYRCGGHYDVRDSRGKLVEPRKPRMMFKGGGSGHLIGTKDNVLQPSESNIERGGVSEAFDMSKPGTYTIQLSQHVANDPKSDEVKSNIVTITVLPVGEKSPVDAPR